MRPVPPEQLISPASATKPAVLWLLRCEFGSVPIFSQYSSLAGTFAEKNLAVEPQVNEF